MHVSVQHIHIPTDCITYKEPTLNLYLIGAESIVCSAWCIFQFRKPVKKQKNLCIFESRILHSNPWDECILQKYIFR